MIMSLLSLFTILINTGYGSSDRDIGCNYVNNAGYAMAMDYCMGFVSSGFNLGLKYVCNDAWDGVNMEYYFDDECTGSAILSEPINSSYDQ